VNFSTRLKGTSCTACAPYKRKEILIHIKRGMSLGWRNGELRRSEKRGRGSSFGSLRKLVGGDVCDLVPMPVGKKGDIVL